MINFRGKSKEKNFEKYIVDNKERLYKIAYCYVKNHHDALDILQESILKAYENIDKLKEIEALDKWMSRIVVNTAIDFIRKNSKVMLVDDENLSDKCISENNTEVNMLIDSLDPELKTIIILKYFHGYKINEVADILEITVSTVKNKIHKALKQLRIEIKEDNYE